MTERTQERKVFLTRVGVIAAACNFCDAGEEARPLAESTMRAAVKKYRAASLSAESVRHSRIYSKDGAQ